MQIQFRMELLQCYLRVNVTKRETNLKKNDYFYPRNTWFQKFPWFRSDTQKHHLGLLSDKSKCRTTFQVLSASFLFQIGPSSVTCRHSWMVGNFPR